MVFLSSEPDGEGEDENGILELANTQHLENFFDFDFFEKADRFVTGLVAVIGLKVINLKIKNMEKSVFVTDAKIDFTKRLEFFRINF